MKYVLFIKMMLEGFLRQAEFFQGSKDILK